jgi:hypothetical protein
MQNTIIRSLRNRQFYGTGSLKSSNVRKKDSAIPGGRIFNAESAENAELENEKN